MRWYPDTFSGGVNVEYVGESWIWRNRDDGEQEPDPYSRRLEPGLLLDVQEIAAGQLDIIATCQHEVFASEFASLLADIATSYKEKISSDDLATLTTETGALSVKDWRAKAHKYWADIVAQATASGNVRKFLDDRDIRPSTYYDAKKRYRL